MSAGDVTTGNGPPGGSIRECCDPSQERSLTTGRHGDSANAQVHLWSNVVEAVWRYRSDI